MSLTDRARKLQKKQDQDQQQGTSSTLALADPPIVRRMRLLFDEVSKRTELTGRNGFIFKIVMEETLERMSEEENTEFLGEWMLITSQIMRWIATGDESDIPEQFRDKILEAESNLALPAGDAMIAHS